MLADAREALDDVGRAHAIFSDLTFPGTPEDCELLTIGWFSRLKSRLHPGGVLAVNAVSPDRMPSAYWSIYQSLRAAGLASLPGHFYLPSFAELGYGRWGFLLASDRRIQGSEINDRWRECFTHPAPWADLRLTAQPLADGRALFAALLESPAAPVLDSEGPSLDFLGFADPSAVPQPSAVDPLNDTRLRAWLARTPGSGIDDLLTAVPLSHRAVTRDLVRDWGGYLVEALSAIDLRRLIEALIRRASALPGRVVAELKRFRRLLARGLNPAEDLTTWGWRFFSVLMLVLVLSQTAMPTAAYAKGGSSFHGGSYIGTSRSGSFGGRSVFFGRGWGYRSHGGSGTSGTGSSEEDEQMRKVLGGLLLAGGAAVVAASVRRRED